MHRAFMAILGLEGFDQFREIVAAHERGQIPPTVMWGACPTQFDPRQAPVNGHTAFMWEKLPYAIHGHPQHWERIAHEHAGRLLRFWTQYAPNLADAVVDSFPRSPLDTERTLPNMQAGDLLVGSFGNGQVGENRPFAGAGRYRTPLPGLYLCGGSTHPGGNITGLCGYNAARVIADRFGLPGLVESTGCRACAAFVNIIGHDDPYFARRYSPRSTCRRAYRSNMALRR